MTFLLSLPGGAEWITLFFVGIVFIGFPVLSIILYLRNKDLKRQLDAVTKQRDDLMNSIIV